VDTGVCAGWFYTMGSYYWQGELYTHASMLGLTQTGEGSITDLADYESKQPFKITGTTAGAGLYVAFSAFCCSALHCTALSTMTLHFTSLRSDPLHCGLLPACSVV